MTRRDDDADGYEVGYRKPPTSNRFQPGRSGNPKGRPKGTKNLKTALIEELSKPIVVREGGKTRRVSKLSALLVSLMTRGLTGDIRAAGLVISTMLRLNDAGEIQPDAGPQTFADLIRRASEEKARKRNAAANASLDGDGDAE